jgi:tRNA-guanine family transglycosylase
LELSSGESINPQGVLDLQCQFANIAATLDCIIPPNLDFEEAKQRQYLTLKNALFTLKLWEDMEEPKPLLFASVQAWDPCSAKWIIEQLSQQPFNGYALGGMVPRTSRPNDILNIVDAIREVDHVRPLHVFGLGTPKLVKMLFEHGVDSVDSSAFIQHGVLGRQVNQDTGSYQKKCEADFGRKNGKFTKQLSNVGMIANMGQVLKNLKDTLSYLGLFPTKHNHAKSQTIMHADNIPSSS